ncbi:MAG: ABC transporter substrate-binding protein [Veillonellaceae bacterium]|jgi:branched-chain amino acid transport system substrate-binding protein|nr:ABC transporter substrate-binding protein [Veillonellaceae bacterium]
MKKRWTILGGLAIAMGIALTGCGGEKAKPAAQPNEIRIGGNVEMTGGVANYGNQALSGMKLAFKQVNAAGGVLGKKINLILADNKSEPAEAANATTKLITQDKVTLVMGPIVSSNVLATVKIAEDNKVVVMTPTGTNEKITVDNGKVRPFAFRACFIDPFQGRVMANYATKSLKSKTAVIYIDSSSDYSKGVAAAFEETFVKNGGKIVGKEAFLQKDQDFKATLTKIKAMNADIVFIPAYYEEVGKIVKQARELGITQPLLGTDGWDNPKVVEIAGAAALNNTFFSNHYSSQDSDPNVRKFIEAYKAEYKEEPSSMAALGYDAAMIVIDAIKRANTTDAAKVKEALEQTKNLQVSTGIVTMDSNHNPIKSAVVIEMKDGKQTFKEKINP